MLAAGIAQAQVHTTGLPTTKTCPATAPDPPGSAYQCTFTVTNADDQHGVRNLAVTDTAPFPGGATVAVSCMQLGVPVTTLGAAGSGTESCAGSTTIDPDFNCSGVDQFNQDRIVATAVDDAGVAPFDGLPVDGAASNNTLIPPLVCDDNNICTNDSCSVETGCTNAAIVCQPDTNDCTEDPLCDPAVPGSELCPNPNTEASTPCGTDTDGNDCTAPGCDGLGACQQNHILDAASTPCGTDTDGNDCTAPGCTAAGVCDQGHILDAASTPCGTDGDPNDCVAPGCTAAGVCDPAHIESAPSTPCGPDTDGLECTTPGCIAGGICSQTHVEDCEVNEEICRTPGFWGTHGGTEKAGSTNITLALLNAYNAVNDPDLQICGQTINNTTLGSVNSALEAICASPKGDQRIQLARQLTSAALNCIITNASGVPVEGSCTDFGAGLAGDVCSGVSIGGIFDACNDACAAGDVTADVDLDDDPLTPDVAVSCIGAIDCFNNGGVINETTGECEEAEGETCHDRQLVNGCFDFQPPGPAGSPRECNDSRKNDVIVVPPAP